MLQTNTLQIIDISNINKSTGDLLLDAASSQGFLFITGHGFTQEEVDLMFDISKQFFNLPLKYKSSFPIGANNFGYDFGGENLDPSTQKYGDPKESINFDVLGFINNVKPQVLPDWFFKDKSRYNLVRLVIEKLSCLSLKLLQILALGLEIDDKNWFDSRYDSKEPSGSIFRMLHYPGQKRLNPETIIRAGAHTDYGSMTLLFQQEGEEGLEIYSPVLKSWEAVPYVEANAEKYPGQAPPIIVNIADQLSYWTSGLLKSTVHRVKFPAKAQISGKDRYSIVFFSHPNNETVLEPIPSAKISSIQGRGANLETRVTAKQHLQKRLSATYGWKY